MNDLKFAYRQLRKNPGFTTVALLTLALGIGINTAMFSMLKELLFYPLPYPQPGALVKVSVGGEGEQSAADFLDERQQNTSFAHVAAYQGWLSGANLSSSSGPAQGVNVLWATGSLFDTLQTPPILGRALSDETDQPGHDQVAVLSHRLWISRTVINQAMANKLWPGKNPVGQHISFDMTPHWLTIAGVVSDVVGANAGECYAYVPPGWFQCSTLVFRSQSPLKATAPALRQIVAGIDPGLPVLQLESASQAFAGAQAPMRLIEGLIVAFGILGLLLAVIGVYGVIAYTVSQRTGEFGIRMALGAQRSDILRLILGRGLRLILSGALLGIAGAIGILRVFAALIPIESPTTLPPATFAGTSEAGWLIIIGVSAVLIAAGMLACYLPARRALRIKPTEVLRYE